MNHSVPLLYGSLFLLYTQAVLNDAGAGKWKIFHFAPFTIMLIMELFLLSSGPHPYRVETFRLIHTGLAATSVMVYGLLTPWWIGRFGKHIDNHFSSRETYITLIWIRNLAFGFIVFFGLSFLALFAGIISDFSIGFLSPFGITSFPLSFFIYYFSLFVSRQIELKIDYKIEEKREDDESKYK